MVWVWRVQIGFHHGVDDAFYVQKYGARYWVLENHPADKLNGLTVWCFGATRVYVAPCLTTYAVVVLRFAGVRRLTFA